MKSKIYLLNFILIMILGACENKLDIDQKGVTTIEDFYQTDEDAEEAVAAVYTQWKNTFSNAGYGSLFFFENMLSDDMWAGGGARGDNKELEELNEFRHTSGNGLISSVYSYYYTIIYRANLILDNFEPGESDTKDNAIAEAKFFRAWSYFYLTAYWGNPPLVTHVLDGLSEETAYTQSNSTPEALWTQIESDLQDAIKVLPEKEDVNDAEAAIRATKHAAQALLGKAYVFQKKYDDAVTILDNLINSGKYDLYRGNYEDIHQSTSDFDTESILEMNSVYDEANPQKDFTLWNIMINWRLDAWNLGAFAYTLYYNGWGFAAPRKSLYDAFIEWEGPNSYRLTNTIKTASDVYSMGGSVKEGKKVYGNEGYLSWKWRATYTDNVAYSFGGFASNHTMMRYAEVLLLAAEAHLKAGNGSRAKADEYVNKIRERAQLASLSNIDMEVVKTEKRLELWGEGIRYLDLVRWGEAEQLLGNQGKAIPVFDGTDVEYVEYTSNYGWKSGKNELMPYPEQETIVNEKIKQNSGW
jgi:hypothetical protein